MLQKHPHAVLPAEFAFWSQVVVIPGLASIGALGTAARMSRPRARTQGEFVVPRDHYPPRGSQDNLIAAGLEQLGVKGVLLMEWPAALVCPQVLHDPIDEGFNGHVRQHHQIRCSGLGIRYEQLLLDPSLVRYRLPILGLLIGMAGGGAVILEQFSGSQFDFPPSFRQPQIVGDGLFEKPLRLKPQDRCVGRRLKLNSEHRHQDDLEQSIRHGRQYNASSSIVEIASVK